MRKPFVVCWKGLGVCLAFNVSLVFPAQSTKRNRPAASPVERTGAAFLPSEASAKRHPVKGRQGRKDIRGPRSPQSWPEGTTDYAMQDPLSLPTTACRRPAITEESEPPSTGKWGDAKRG
ncbi:hypothetical protein MRX96_028726 [Rhipicephalus microplus]